MKLVSSEAAFGNAETGKELVGAVKSGGILIYPTDTVYGIGCSLENAAQAKKIYEAKERPLNKPFSVIVPSEEWIYRNCYVAEENRAVIEGLLPGPYTLVLRLSEKRKFELHRSNDIGVRIPRHPIAGIIKEAGIPLITTSVNISGYEPVKNVQEIPAKIKVLADWIIDGGELAGKPSRVFDMTAKDIRMVRY